VSAVAGDCVVGEYERSNGLLRDAKQGWVRPLVGGEVWAGETDRGRAAVVVDGKVDEPLVLGTPDLVGHELTRQVAVAAVSRQVVDNVLGQDDVANEQPSARAIGDLPAEEHRSLLVMISGEEMAMENVPVGLGGVQLERRELVTEDLYGATTRPRRSLTVLLWVGVGGHVLRT